MYFTAIIIFSDYTGIQAKTVSVLRRKSSGTHSPVGGFSTGRSPKWQNVIQMSLIESLRNKADINQWNNVFIELVDHGLGEKNFKAPGVDIGRLLDANVGFHDGDVFIRVNKN